MADDHIDLLLERYLGLLDEYTTLRESLSKSQASMYHDIARANFSAERGIRYGPDYYDERMQASRILAVTTADDAEQVPAFESIKAPEPEPSKDAPEAEGEAPPKPKSKDPLRWFGILAPQPLRQAQAHAVSAVDTLIPRLATVDAEMKHVEIQIRRARKKRTKAAATSTTDDISVKPVAVTLT
ncbi:hypothetical protein F5X68DRAFT_43146 [Plectosphaerella plurivora]|uniref:Vacuolar ATPase assembly protein VMA22 n=1 Tax=Plectosphaerella plurivora TaxID=936078 RepID=A0A9P8V443_9PEZI|nr:hypothetical protein F5X68DRAFT_43146 [Plectosphaerella plurivora]